MSPDSLVCLGFLQYDAMSLLFWFFPDKTSPELFFSHRLSPTCTVAIHIQPYCVCMGLGKKRGTEGQRMKGWGYIVT